MKKSLISFLETLTAGVVLAVLIMLFVGQSLEITGNSMYPTLKNGERIIVEKVSYKNAQPKVGEIIVFRSLPDDGIFLIKRVVGTAENAIDNPTERDLGVVQKYAELPIPKGYLAVMGDNKEESYDSRMFGLVPLEKVVGKAFVVYWPPAVLRKINL